MHGGIVDRLRHTWAAGAVAAAGGAWMATAAMAAGAAPADGAGTLVVEVRYGGPPMAERMKVTRDVEQCGAEVTVERVGVGRGGGLANAVVAVTGLPGGPEPRPPRPVMEEKGCQFVPRVVVMRPGEIEFRNADDVLHSVHTYATANPTITRAQPRTRKVTTARLEQPEVVKVTCDVHPWMLGWVAVVPNPWAAVTGESGHVRLERVPAGRHTVEVWHEVLGRQTRPVEIRSGQVAHLTVEMPRR